ncbi:MULTISPECIES: xanthine dehydrogenase family protein molybdopterin-binding subunit [unclassified Crossiella]|uniref:xanthine dehydrogenase family protein molybdopterin-binding subunit n=1 Tax=unclassified Crossiella TaxID=2620835 RepID=UPI002000217A|nr:MULTISPECIES: xanthine dehydrogenase family protein molybdopterin-binding subunit [unclassified Crossiella]MCK2238951.1 xanthine dehydrogenase family protein molybdopterin-binding subunit [Crossiella sp. S99.2]MCK2251479.1 xanthine dehydrogenase family protein molybdopterin-binding subunit [Crossiella sp. S99.1]
MTTSPLGREIDRVDGPPKVTGSAPYAADYRPDGLVHGYLVQATVGRGTVRAMEVARAEAAPGVLAVFTPFRPLPLNPPNGGGGENYSALQDTAVRFRGQIIGLVVADTFEHARDAAALVSADYAVTPSRTSLAGASPGVSQGVVQKLAPGVPSIEAALAASPVTVTTSVSQPAHHHIAMEPHATTAVWVDDQLTVYCGAQAPQRAAATIADRLGVERAKVRLICRHTGGGFGQRSPVWNEALLCAAAARALRRPVKLVLSREQVFTAIGHRGAVRQTIRLGAEADGRLRALSHDSDGELPAAGGWQMMPGRDTSAVTYRTPNIRIDQRLVTLDTPPTWSMRAPAESPGMFALETAMDELAVRTGVDPVELRLRNYATEDPVEGRRFSSKHLDECYRAGAERFGWKRRQARPRSRTEGDWLIGMGMASAIYPAWRQFATARARFRDDGFVAVASATSDIGTGALTMLAAVGADELGLPVSAIAAEAGDSALPPGGVGAYGSSVTTSTVPAVQAACRAAVTALIQAAVANPRSPFAGLDPATVRYRRGRIEASGRAVDFGTLLRTMGVPSVEAVSTSAPAAGADQYRFHCFGAHFCEVRVNRLTGEPRVNRFTSVFDVGRVVNAKAARGQLVGSIIWGIGHALLEADPIEPDGRFAAASLADYLVPVHADTPEIDVHWLDRPDPHISEFGAKGLGEIGLVSAAAAIGNAVYNATGIRVHDLPITLDKLL